MPLKELLRNFSLTRQKKKLKMIVMDFRVKLNRYAYIVSLILLSTFSYAQEVTTYNSDSSLIITKEVKLDELITKQKQQNVLNQTIHGYRIQIFFGGNRQKASEVKIDFNSRYPEISAYISYQQPNFKVRIGDFSNRFEAQKFLKEINRFFPTCFIVSDEVKLPPLK